MNCGQIDRLISAYIDGELAGVEMLAVKRHISNCPRCADEFESIRNVKRMMSGMAYVTPQRDLTSLICTRIDECRVPKYLRLFNSVVAYGRSHVNPALAALGAVGAALVVLTAGSVIDNRHAVVNASFSPKITLRPVYEPNSATLKLETVADAPVIPAERPVWFAEASYSLR